MKLKTGKVTKKKYVGGYQDSEGQRKKREGNKCKGMRESGHSLVDNYSLV